METQAIKIQQWWKRRYALQKVVLYLKQHLSQQHLQELSNKCHSIQTVCQGDGAGLEGGSYIDRLICEFFQDHLKDYIPYHNGESDMKICQHPLSFKKISGASSIALDWSKNATSTKRAHFTNDIMILNLSTKQWWKNKVNYTDTIPSGIYFIDSDYCQYNITLSSNNKTNTLISKTFVYQMLHRSLTQKWYIELPPPNKKYRFKLSQAFLEE